MKTLLKYTIEEMLQRNKANSVQCLSGVKTKKHTNNKKSNNLSIDIWAASLGNSETLKIGMSFFLNGIRE